MEFSENREVPIPVQCEEIKPWCTRWVVPREYFRALARMCRAM